MPPQGPVKLSISLLLISLVTVQPITDRETCDWRDTEPIRGHADLLTPEVPEETRLLCVWGGSICSQSNYRTKEMVVMVTVVMDSWVTSE